MPKAAGGEQGGNGRSFWDYWFAATGWDRFGFVASTMVVAGGVAGVAWLVTSKLLDQVAHSDVSITDDNGVISISKNAGKETHHANVIVSAVGGWQSTGIVVQSGARVTIRASGLASVGAVEHDWVIITRRMQTARGSPAAESVPHCVTETDGGVGILGGAHPCFGTDVSQWPKEVPWPYVGPNGYSSVIYKAADPKVRPLLVNRLPFGALVAYVGVDPGTDASLDEASDKGILIGEEHFFKCEMSGTLWLAVNDDVGMLDDNAGFFVARITVEPAG